jgi:glycerol-3-phosphate dehydrogenase
MREAALTDQVFDVAIIGGGINGTGIARDAAGRKLSVYLCEQDDLASGTSSWSTKLIHGGLRYLEHYEFRLVREALMEREILWGIAPNIIWPLRFVLPYHTGLRPAWILRIGLFMYDHLGGRKWLPATRTLDLKKDVAGKPLKTGATIGFEYSDCWVEDSRLVVMNAMDARDHGAVIETRHKLVSARREKGVWHLSILNQSTGEQKYLHAKSLVNASGPWVADVLAEKITSNTQAKIRMVQGSHIVVPRLYGHDRCYIFQNSDGRIIFAIPYEQDFTLIGTTDLDYKGDPALVKASTEEIAYLCAAASEYFEKPILTSDIVWTYSGVRPLYDDGASKAQEATRDYVLKLDAPENEAALLSIFGGKITTYRRLAEEALEKLSAFLPGNVETQRGWTGKKMLPGGDFDRNGFDGVVEALGQKHPKIRKALLRRLVRAYGTRAALILGNAESERDLGDFFGDTLSEAEIRYLITYEWVVTAHDVLWRRSKLGLRLTSEQVQKLEAFIASVHAHAA